MTASEASAEFFLNDCKRSERQICLMIASEASADFLNDFLNDCERSERRFFWITASEASADLS